MSQDRWKIFIILDEDLLDATENYINPIQHRRGPYGPHNDIYSFLAPLWSKLSTYTFGLFLNIVTDPFWV
jgi:hypothetical protein